MKYAVGDSYYSQNDLRLHFGLDQAQVVDSLEIRWPSGQVDSFRNLEVNRLYIVQEGARVRNLSFSVLFRPALSADIQERRRLGAE
jgi:ASPIC and UnbV